jgi:hypothetical protein
MMMAIIFSMFHLAEPPATPNLPHTSTAYHWTVTTKPMIKMIENESYLLIKMPENESYLDLDRVLLKNITYKLFLTYF